MFPVIVDGEPPKATVEVCLVDCTCAGCEIVFSSHTNEAECLPDEVVCGDDCSGLASWAIDIYDRYPFDVCCLVPCYEPIESDSGVCPIDFTTTCLTDLVAGATDTVYAVVTLVDNVGNDRRFGATITFNPDICSIIIVEPWPAGDCVDTPDFVYCDDTDVIHPGDNGDVTPPDGVEDVNDGPAPVELGTAESEGFVILSEAGITDIPPSVITGNIGTWPIAGSFIGVTCAEVSGTIYDRDGNYTGGGGGSVACRLIDEPLLNAAVIDMRAAYTAAAGATPGVGPFLNLGGGTVHDQTLVPGVYTWGSNVTITSDLVLFGGENDVWIFQITGTLDISSNMKVLLVGGAQAKNIFWQVADVVTLGTGSHFEGIILAKTKIAMQTGASINGRLWAQTEVTLDHNTVTEP
jgi:hypothetical protein